MLLPQRIAAPVFAATAQRARRVVSAASRNWALCLEYHGWTAKHRGVPHGWVLALIDMSGWPRNPTAHFDSSTDAERQVTPTKNGNLRNLADFVARVTGLITHAGNETVAQTNWRYPLRQQFSALLTTEVHESSRADDGDHRICSAAGHAVRCWYAVRATAISGRHERDWHGTSERRIAAGCVCIVTTRRSSRKKITPFRLP